MRKCLLPIVFLTGILLFTASCTEAQKNTSLPPAAFSKNISTTGITLLDARTPDEFKEGHLKNALNIDWNGDSFEKDVAQLDKKTPVYVYCHSGRRSAAAAKKMRKMGFIVYELDGGIMAWDDAKLPKE